ncbi:MAG: polyribonucleotide nucleotidyltransferase [Chloroflexi bacterium]|nr:polyribonucleotide nucleotidyltransferase [Chloroflexota bacterium]
MISHFASEIGSKTLTFETGKLAQQAGGSVVLRYGDNVMLATATMAKPREGIDFFPLTVDFEERMYARGKIPGSFFRREGRPSTPAILIARMTDRTVRPLFPSGFKNEVQVILTPLSSDQENPFEPLAIIGASAALAISDIPFDGPVSATRMGYVDGEFIVNPTFEQLEASALDLLVSGSREGVVMIEAGGNELSESLMFQAIEKAQEVNQQVIALQQEAIDAVGKAKASYDSKSYPDELAELVAGAAGHRVGQALDDHGFDDGVKSLAAELQESAASDHESGHVKEAVQALVGKEFRRRIIEGGPRPDGRSLTEIRPVSAEVALLPRTHGSGLFARGETQILAVATLGSVGDAQKIDTLSPEDSKSFMLHYNFPPYSTGEAKRVGSPGRREIGHGALAEKAIAPVLPSHEEFPYTLRLVCEALSSNGSTSMASVCASTLALMDAGVNIKTPVAGISIGLITGDDGKYVTLTDIQGLEDHVGDMDFKVAGTKDGITAIQLDIKVKSIGFDVVKDALDQARVARLFLLDKMLEAIPETRTEMSPYAPRMVSIKIPVDKIGAVIGPGGKTIRGIVEVTGATVDVQDDGTVVIGSTDGEASDKAVQMIKDLTREIEVGEIFTGKVVKIAPFGAFVQILPGKDGLVHISELADYHVPSVEDVVQLGEEITVVVKGKDPSGKISLSRRMLLQQQGESSNGGADGPPESSQTGGDRPAGSGYRSDPPGGGGPRGDRGPGGPRRYDRRPPSR